MEYKDFCNVVFSGGMGLVVKSSLDVRKELVTVDFDTGDCEDAFGSLWAIDDVDHFFYYDGSPVKGQKI
jgi:hypothetical protein